MAAATDKPILASNDPGVFFTGTQLMVTVPLSNIGTATASNVFITAATLGTAQRISPANFPVFVGTLGAASTGSASARFSGAGLVVGQKYLLTLRGTYGNPTAGFMISRYLTVPPVQPFPVPLLNGRVVASVQPAVWSYTIFNDEAPGSNLFISAFSLDIVAPIGVLRTPPGWRVLTDSLTYVGWYATDTAQPYPSHIAPGTSLAGFEIQSATSKSESTSYALSSTDHQTGNSGLAGIDLVLSPGRPL